MPISNLLLFLLEKSEAILTGLKPQIGEPISELTNAPGSKETCGFISLELGRKVLLTLRMV